MKLMTIVFLLLASVHLSCAAERNDSLLLMFWNMENFYDYIDQGNGESDREFSSMGARHWTKGRFYRKCDDVAKAIFWIEGRYGRMPDMIGMAEIENRGVLSRLVAYTLLRKYDYGIIHFDSRDRRGIDVAVLYRKPVLSPVSSVGHVTVCGGDTLSTRDILHVKFRENRSGKEMEVLVNHHPSKYGGSAESEARRAACMRTLKHLCDSIQSVSDVPVIAMGDFNDTPEASAFYIMSGTMINKGKYFRKRGEGTIRYEGKWELIDMFLVDPGTDGTSDMEICRIPFLMKWDNRHPGEKPFRTYSGPRYIGGVSDHCPVILELSFSRF